jgi:CBS domain-containing protein
MVQKDDRRSRMEERVRSVEVIALETAPPVVLDAETPVREVIRSMCDMRSGCALLTRDGKLAGIFTERDVLLRIVDNDDAMDRPVAEWMTPDPVTARETDPIHRALTRMSEGGFRNVPVTDDDGRVVGCIRHKDIVRYLVAHYAHHLLNLPSDPEQVCRSPEGG